MSKSHILNSNASPRPEALKMLGQLFDEVWASVAADFGDDPDEIETARIRLATIILDLARDGELGPLHITAMAAGLIREKLPQGPPPSLPHTKSATIEA
jgi:hypothetical protein